MNATVPSTMSPVAVTLIDQERQLLRDLKAACQERARAEAALVNVFNNRVAQTTTAWETAQKRIAEEYDREVAAAHAALSEHLDRLKAEIAAEDESLKLAFAEAKEKIETDFQTEKRTTLQAYKDARWSTRMVYDANKASAKQAHLEATTRTHSAMMRFQHLIQEAQAYLRECRLPTRYTDVTLTLPISDEPAPPDPLHMLDQYVKLAEEQMVRLKELALPKMLRGWWLMVALAVGAMLLVVGVGLVTRDLAFAAVVGGGSALVIGLGIWLGLRETAKAMAYRICANLTEAVADGKMLKDACLQQAERLYKRQVAGFQKERQKELDQAAAQYEPKLAELKKRRVQELRRVTNQYQPQLAALQARFDFEKHAIETNHEERLQLAKARHDRDLAQARREFEAAKEDIMRSQREAFQEMAAAWRQALHRARTVAEAINDEGRRLFPSWADLAERPGPTDIPRVLRIGELEVKIHSLPAGVPVDSGLKAESAFTLRLPALVPFPTPGHLLLRAGHAGGKSEAVKLLRTVTLRYLTALPPGKVKLTIIDPVGLGDNFAALMHLADFDESLVAHRIWTEPAHIEQRLADLTAHMESIIQKYLRNQYATIEAYNAEAGEVAEPFRLLVIAGFPVNFTADAARRLVSTITSGARCGVVSLIAMDTQQELPDGFQLGDIEPFCVNLEWPESCPVWHDPDFCDLPLLLDPPPTQEQETAIIRRVGAAAMDAKRVEVPFEFIAPRTEDWWKGDSARQLLVPLGRVGATRRQALHLGLGTAQHALIAGKTGSGKSTLLHVLITNLALHYAPDQVELYLIDFKKGVEFKTYATHALPHVRVVAVESEREFGLSVLHRLDQELKRRGDLFRSVGAQDLAAAREAAPRVHLPRVLLIVDEFQEFFTEDDRLSQEAGLILDRLVRQGRAFGMHVILGSQTIGGAYTLTRSTIDQMAVRIALPCSEADGHLILSEGNSAARLLSRPGDAIYNDMSGLVEGNHPFQVAWLPEERRETLLAEIRQRLASRDGAHPGEPIVFEGNAPADLGKNHLLRELWTQPPAAPPKEAWAWLGEPIAIKEPTAALFRRQSGRHLLVIGQDEMQAQGVLAAALLSLRGSYTPETGRFFFVTVAPDSEETKPLVHIVQRLKVAIVPGREVPQLMRELTDELTTRQQAPEEHRPPVFLFLHGLHRLRDLRRAEDDYGFNKEAATPPQQLSLLIREGPSLGLHVLATVDSLGGLLRVLERSALREIDMRVLFQMSSGDSSNLIDTPAASKLGLHRALFSSEDQGKLEKFRPYALPSETVLAALGIP